MSTDPDFLAKMHRILNLYDHPPDDERAICVDQFRPLNFQPHNDEAWRPARSPRRLRATYKRQYSVMHMLAALHLSDGKIHYHIRCRKHYDEFLKLIKSLRARRPGQKLYIVADNFSLHRHPYVQDRAESNAVDLVFLQTYSNWPNWIEAELTVLRYFARNGTDHYSHTEQNAAIAAYIRWHNARAQPKTGFVTDSPIRTWTQYPAEVV
ncbi:transposase [Saccharothrix lopnurensis]|uniref:Transposase n=1 Tax=Saccharothrix lopnurensis TaxID=1670621 RepID=A0ABW1NX78_9PSEU